MDNEMKRASKSIYEKIKKEEIICNEITIEEIIDNEMKRASMSIYEKIKEIIDDEKIREITIEDITKNENMRNYLPLIERIKEIFAKYDNIERCMNDKNDKKLMIILSCVIGDINMCRYLYENGIEVKDHKFLTHAALNGHQEIVRYLVEKGVDMNSSYALAYSGHAGHIEIVKYLVEQGANIRDKEDINLPVFIYANITSVMSKKMKGVPRDALIEAAREGHLEVVKYLIEKGADYRNTNILKESVYYDNVEVVKYILQLYTEKRIEITNYVIPKNVTESAVILFGYARGAHQRLSFHPRVLQRYCEKMARK